MTVWQRQLAKWATPVVLILVWEVLTRTEVLDPRFFVPVSVMVVTLIEIAASGRLFAELADTLTRVLIGFGIAAVGGTLLGLAAGSFPAFGLALRPIVDTLYPMPKISWLPLLLMFVGFGETAFIIIALATAFFAIMIMVARSIADFPPLLAEAGRNFGASGIKYFTRVIFPGILPSLLQALRLGMVLALISVIVVEFVTAQSGLGHMVHLAWQQLQVEILFAGLLAAGILGQLINLVFNGLNRVLVPWQRDATAVLSAS